MKYVYVLTSSPNDFYYEQFLISVVSLRYHNPNVNIVALIDSKTKQGLTGKRSGYEQYVSDIVTIKTPETLSQKEVSRWIKTSMKNYVTGDFLYIDCDTVITENLEYDFPPEINIGAILDTHVVLSKHHLAPFFKTKDKRLGFSSTYKLDNYYNGGIIFCRDTPESIEFFSKWHSLWLYCNKKGVHQDMPALNQANYELNGIIKELQGIWNCQVTHNGLSLLHNAKIIHCFASSIWLFNCPFLPASVPVMTSVKETGRISLQLMEYLKNPKTAFTQEVRIISGEMELDVINSKLFSLLLFIRKKMPKFFRVINSFLLKTRASTQK
jgi:lipopolysaccharide biosynthesis glycosyltransferase